MERAGKQKIIGPGARRAMVDGAGAGVLLVGSWGCVTAGRHLVVERGNHGMFGPVRRKPKEPPVLGGRVGVGRVVSGAARPNLFSQLQQANRAAGEGAYVRVSARKKSASCSKQLHGIRGPRNGRLVL